MEESPCCSARERPEAKAHLHEDRREEPGAQEPQHQEGRLPEACDLLGERVEIAGDEERHRLGIVEERQPLLDGAQPDALLVGHIEARIAALVARREAPGRRLEPQIEQRRRGEIDGLRVAGRLRPASNSPRTASHSGRPAARPGTRRRRPRPAASRRKRLRAPRRDRRRNSARPRTRRVSRGERPPREAAPCSPPRPKRSAGTKASSSPTELTMRRLANSNLSQVTNSQGGISGANERKEPSNLFDAILRTKAKLSRAAFAPLRGLRPLTVLLSCENFIEEVRRRAVVQKTATKQCPAGPDSAAIRFCARDFNRRNLKPLRPARRSCSPCRARCAAHRH